MKTKVPVSVQNYFALHLHLNACMPLVPWLERIYVCIFSPCVLLAVLRPFRAKHAQPNLPYACFILSVYTYCVSHIRTEF